MSQKVVSISEVISMLDNGKSRAEIAKHYGIPLSAMKEKVFSHPKLKHKKTKKNYDFEVVDETEELNTVEENPQTEVENVSNEVLQQEEIVENELVEQVQEETEEVQEGQW